eukprot:gene11593-biopygen6599
MLIEYVGSFSRTPTFVVERIPGIGDHTMVDHMHINRPRNVGILLLQLLLLLLPATCYLLLLPPPPPPPPPPPSPSLPREDYECPLCRNICRTSSRPE